MKTLVVAGGRYAALFTREPQINRPRTPTLVIPSSRHVLPRFLSRSRFPVYFLPNGETRSNRGGGVGKDQIAVAVQLVIFQ